MSYQMTVTCTDREFSSYWYGVGKVILVEPLSAGPNNQVTRIVDYGADEFRANYQADRFASGLIFAKVEWVSEPHTIPADHEKAWEESDNLVLKSNAEETDPTASLHRQDVRYRSR